MYELYVGNRRPGIVVTPDPKWPKMWRIHQGGRVSDMVNLSRAKDAAVARMNLGGTEVARWSYRQAAGEAPTVH